MKRQPTKWETIFTNDMLAKGLTSKVYKKLIQFNIKRSIKKKISRKSEQTFFQRRQTDKQFQAYEKMLNIASHQRKANQNYNEMSLHTYEDDYHQKCKT